MPALGATGEVAVGCEPEVDGEVVEDPMQELRARLADAGIPEAAMPQSLPVGSKSYTLKGSAGAKVEVQHFAKKYYIQDKKGGHKLGVDISPSVAFSKFGGATGAWNQVMLLIEDDSFH